MTLSGSDAGGDGGWATAAFAAVSLAGALIAAAVVARAGAELRAARADQERLRAAYVLDGALARAAVVVMAQDGQARLGWRDEADGRAVSLLAEPEDLKLDLATAAGALDDADLARLGVADAGRTRGNLKAMAAAGGLDRDAILKAGAGELWNACAPGLISPFGTSEPAPAAAVRAPATGVFNWRIGEVWRLRARSADGWIDDRLVRFTGDSLRPAAVISRRFLRATAADIDCDGVLGRGKR